LAARQSEATRAFERVLGPHIGENLGGADLHIVLNALAFAVFERDQGWSEREKVRRILSAGTILKQRRPDIGKAALHLTEQLTRRDYAHVDQWGVERLRRRLPTLR